MISNKVTSRTIAYDFFLVFAAGGRDCDICIFDMRERRRVGATNRILPSRHVELVHFPQKSQRSQEIPQRHRRSTVHHHRSPYLTGQDKTVSSALGSIICYFSKKIVLSL